MTSYAILFLLASVTILPRCSSADTLVNTFLPGQSYQVNPGSGDSIGDNSYYEYAGVAFTPTGSYTLTQIDLAIATENGSGNLMFNLTLNEDSGGIPGPTIESWEGISAAVLTPGPAADASSVASVSVTSGVVLEAGTQYWIVASDPAAPFGNSLTWFANAPTGAGGTFGSLIPSFFPVWQTTTANNDDLAFDVLGSSAPEPSTLLLLITGLAGAAWYRQPARLTMRNASAKNR